MATVTFFPPTNYDQTTIDYYGGRWEKVDALWLASKNSNLTGFESVKFPWYPLGGSSGLTSNDGTIEGGGSTSAAGNATWQGHGASIFQKIKTAHWGAVWYAKFAAISGANVALIGLSHSFTMAGARTVTFGVDGGTSATNFVINSASGTVATSQVADANFHRFGLIGDTTNVTLYIDGASVGTRVCSALTDEPVYEGIRNTVLGAAIATRLTIGFVQP